VTSPHQPRSTLADFCSAFASTQPPSLPPTRSWESTADRLLAATRPQLVPLLVCLGFLASVVSRVLPAPLGMLALAAFFLVAGGWCTLNLVRCREAHCLATGLGWDALGMVVLGAIVVGIDLRAWVSPAPMTAPYGTCGSRSKLPRSVPGAGARRHRRGQTPARTGLAGRPARDRTKGDRPASVAAGGSARGVGLAGTDHDRGAGRAGGGGAGRPDGRALPSDRRRWCTSVGRVISGVRLEAGRSRSTSCAVGRWFTGFARWVDWLPIQCGRGSR
jgi:hypothetical protein